MPTLHNNAALCYKQLNSASAEMLHANSGSPDSSPSGRRVLNGSIKIQNGLLCAIFWSFSRGARHPPKSRPAPPPVSWHRPLAPWPLAPWPCRWWAPPSSSPRIPRRSSRRQPPWACSPAPSWQAPSWQACSGSHHRSPTRTQGSSHASAPAGVAQSSKRGFRLQSLLLPLLFCCCSRHRRSCCCSRHRRP